MKPLLFLLLLLMAFPLDAQDRRRALIAKVNADKAAGGGGAPTFPTGAVAGWKMDEASGTRVDHFTGNDLAVVGTVNAVAGIINNGSEFTGAFGALSKTDTADLSMGAGVQFTISFWVHSSADNDWFTLLTKDDDGTNPEYQFYRNGTTDKLTFVVWDSGGSPHDVVSTATINNGTTYHVVARYDGAELKLWLTADTAGTLASPDTVGYSGDVRDTASPFHIGLTVSSILTYTGWFDELYIFKRALTTTEIGNLYNGGAGLQP